MIFVQLTVQERAELRQVSRQEVGRVALRAHMVLLSDRSFSVPQIAEIFDCGQDVVRTWLHRYQNRRVAGLKDEPHSGCPPLAPHDPEALRAQVEEHNDATLAEHCLMWEQTHGVRVSAGTMGRRLRQLGWTRKKKVLVAAERDEEKRAAWWEAMAGVDIRRLVFVDESGITIAMTRRYARAPRGRSPYGYVPRTYGKSITLIAALALDGIGAVMTLEGAANAVAFEAYVRELLVPTLTKGCIVVIDNVTIHQSDETRRLIEQEGCELRFLPPHSSDFCPVDLAFAKIKEYLRAVGARTADDLVAAVAQAVDTVTPEDAAGYFRHCGYLPAPETSNASQTKTVQGE